jgi:hypothetical protein
MARWSLAMPCQKLVKMGPRPVRHLRRLVLQMAGVAVTRELLEQILSRLRSLSPVPT